MRRIAEESGKRSVTCAKLSLQIGRENSHLELRARGRLAAIGPNAGERFLLIRTAVRSRHIVRLG